MLKSVIYLWIILFTMGCDQDEFGKVGSNQEQYLLVVDTVEVEGVEESVWILDKRDDIFLGMNKQRNAIYLINEAGDLRKIIRREGEGPEEYQRIVKAGMLDSSRIVVINQSSLYLYDTEGTFIRSCSDLFTDFLITNYPHAFFQSPKNSVVFTAYHPSNAAMDLNYFSDTTNFLYTAYDPYTCSFTNFGAFEKGSIYREEFFPNMRSGIFDIGPKTGYVYSVLPFDRQMTIYDVQGRGELVGVHQLSPESFPKAKGVSPTDDGIMSQLHLIQRNARNTRLRISADEEYMLIRYKEKRPDDKVEDSLVGFNTSSYAPPHYFSLYTTDGEKVANDFIDPTEATLFEFSSLNELWFFQTSITNEKGLSEEGLFLLKAKISSEE